MWDKKTKRKALAYCGIILALIIITLLIFNSCRIKDENNSPFQNTSNDKLESKVNFVISTGVIKSSDPVEVKQELQEIVDRSKTNITLNMTPCLDDNGYYNIMLQNKSEIDMSYTVEIIDIDTSTSIWKSPIIEPGKYIEKIKFRGTLKAGKRYCLARFIAFDKDGVNKTSFDAAPIFYT